MPQIVKGKLGDNYVDVGMMGAAGTLEGDVMVRRARNDRVKISVEL